VVGGVAAAARERGIDCVVLAGRVSDHIEGVTEAHSLVEYFGSQEQALARPEEGLAALAARVARSHLS
jgi:glycerate kinase